MPVHVVAADHLSIKGARGHVESRYFIIEGLIATIGCEGLDDGVHDLNPSFPASVP